MERSLLVLCLGLAKVVSSFRVVIVGGGVGGLAVASRIASDVDEVIVLEKNDQVGGRCGSFEVKIPELGTFRHERGPSLLLLPQVYRDLFTDCQTDISNFGLEIEQCVPAYQVVFQDGDRINLGFPHRPSPEMRKMEQESRSKMNTFEENGAEKWDQYMRAMVAFLNCGLPNFIEERLDLGSFPAFIVEAIRDFGKCWPLKPHSDVLEAIFESPKMQALASFQDLYVGLEPYRNERQFAGGIFQSTAPAVFGLLAAIELHPQNGVFAPVGGFGAVTSALEKLAVSRGASIRTGVYVDKIQKDGVHCLKGHEFIPADLVITNADLPYATQSLLNSDNNTPDAFDWDDRFSFSSGVTAFHWSLNKSLSDLSTHNVFLCADSRSQAEMSWSIVRGDRSSGGDDDPKPFNFYVHRASQTDPSACPSGCDALMILVPCQTLIREPECAHLPREDAIARYRQQFGSKPIAAVRKAVLQRLSAIDSLQNLEASIINEVVDTPATYADRYNCAAGTPFALSHGLAQLSIARPGAESSLRPNVLFCGASSRPGNGVPLVLLGAKLVAEKTLKYLERSKLTINQN